jgi:very-short-patch-repair endonuclease
MMEIDELAPVLVVIMNNPRDMEIARREGWYRIPVKSAPSRLGAEYLAFYQTKIFGPEGLAINYYAPVKAYRLARRRELLPEEPEHPRANEWYYKVEIGPLEKLPRPIPSRRLRRITFIPTTLGRLLKAQEINDLWIGGEAEESLWELFRENGLPAERRFLIQREEEEKEVDFAFFCRKGKLAIMCDEEPLLSGLVREKSAAQDYELAALGWTTIHLEPELILKSPAEAMSKVLKALEELGGLTSEEEEAWNYEDVGQF